jgi:hypothetical protein
MIGGGYKAKNGQKKPELLQARVESTMEAVEETNGANALFAWAGVYPRAMLRCNIFV